MFGVEVFLLTLGIFSVFVNGVQQKTYENLPTGAPNLRKLLAHIEDSSEEESDSSSIESRFGYHHKPHYPNFKNDLPVNNFHPHHFNHPHEHHNQFHNGHKHNSDCHHGYPAHDAQNFGHEIPTKEPPTSKLPLTTSPTPRMTTVTTTSTSTKFPQIDVRSGI